ncbi:MAG: ParB/RepB/Spo0J family partition protein, partial [Telluria sp.]
MATKKSKGLGRGLDALLGGSSDALEAVAVIAGAPSVMAVGQLQAGKYQP